MEQGLAPAPLSADLDAAPPAIIMTLLPGDALAARPVTGRHLDALAATLDYLQPAFRPAHSPASVATLGSTGAAVADVGRPNVQNAHYRADSASTISHRDTAHSDGYRVLAVTS
jgi:hypothetical protein